MQPHLDHGQGLASRSVVALRREFQVSGGLEFLGGWQAHDPSPAPGIPRLRCTAVPEPSREDGSKPGQPASTRFRISASCASAASARSRKRSRSDSASNSSTSMWSLAMAGPLLVAGFMRLPGPGDSQGPAACGGTGRAALKHRAEAGQLRGGSFRTGPVLRDQLAAVQHPQADALVIAGERGLSMLQQRPDSIYDPLAGSPWPVIPPGSGHDELAQALTVKGSSDSKT